jgi:hypothetical protein
LTSFKVLKRGKELSEWKRDNCTDRCPLCGRSMSAVLDRNKVVDHNHKTGQIRGVLCRNCNAIEGKINNLCVRSGNWISHNDFLNNLMKYWAEQPDYPYYPGTKKVGTKIIPPPKPKRRRRR